MCIEIADRAVHLAQDDDALDGGALALQARRHIGELLADRGRCRRLSVCPRQHADRRVPLGERIEQYADGIEHRQQHGAARAFQHERIRQIIDVLGGAPEVHPFELRRASPAGLEFVADPIFHGLHVVLGARLDGLDGAHVRCRRVGCERLEPTACSLRQRRQNGRAGTLSAAPRTMRIQRAPVRASAQPR